MNVGAWLESLGLERYEPLFRDNEIDWEVLPKLTSEDLKEIGVVAIGHRRKLLDAIAALDAQRRVDVVSPPQRSAPVTADAERRHLTVMFCDLVGSTALSTHFDPEDLREVITAYHRAVAGTVAMFDGFVAKYMGDGVLVYFGYPRAHEDDAERAVRAGLGLIDAVGHLDVKSTKLQVRVGIATGLVVVGDLIGEGSAREQSVVGETPNLAARLQAFAVPDAVVISATTRALVGDLFDYRDLGVFEAKGITEPVPAWQVLRPSIVASRFEALRGSALTQLVGRHEEIELLLRRWARAKAGDGQIVLISAEAGLGKSRITAALEERLQGEPHLRLRCFCSPYHQGSALFPFIDQLERGSEFARDDGPSDKLEKLEALLARAAPPDEDLALLADLLLLPGSDRYVLPALSPQKKKERTLHALIRQLEGLARQQPVVMVIEDAHWIDPTSRELLDLVVERVRGLPVLLIVTFRLEFQPPWTGQPQVSIITLNRLDRRDRTALVAQVAGKALPDEVIAQIVDRADGVPLFVEELTKHVLESGLLREEADRYVLDGALPQFAIPTSLHDSLMARLDRLASVRLVAQIGAAIGREFSYELLHAVSRLAEQELQTSLDRLVASELVFQKGTPPDSVYTFRHALLQDAAHSSLLHSSRSRLHKQIAEALEAHFSEIMDTQPELLAQHYGEAGLALKSAAYWIKAGRNSVARSTMAEAAAQFQKGLDQLALLPKDDESLRQELELRSSLGAVLLALKGYAAPETGQAYARARALWGQLDYPPGYLRIPWGQWAHDLNRGESANALGLANDLLNLSHERRDDGGLVLGHLCSGISKLVDGRFLSARSHLEEEPAHSGPAAYGTLVREAGIHPRVMSQTFLAMNMFCLGYPDQALTRSNAAVAEARRLAHPPSLASGLVNGTRLLSLVGDNATLGDWADQLIALTTEQGFPHWAAQGMIFRGWAKVKDGDVAQGISLLRSGSTSYRATGAELLVPYHIALLAGACDIAGQSEEAATLLDDALRMIERTEERWFAAELNRQKGQMLLRQGHAETAKDLYYNALEIAKAQGAKLWELRAASSLARLFHDRGDRVGAINILAPVYDWFTEGLDTPDLKEARALLEELTRVN